MEEEEVVVEEACASAQDTASPQLQQQLNHRLWM
jgi:hypothetical protein